jgi:hypothetical protein
VLAGVVGAQHGHGHPAHDAADVDHPALAALAHRGQEGPGHGQQPEHVGVEQRPEVTLGHRLQRAREGEAGVVDQHVEPAAAGPALDQPAGGLDRVRVGHVQRQRLHPAAGVAVQGGQGVGPAPAGQDQVAGPGQAQGRVPADARGGAGDQDGEWCRLHDFAAEFLHRSAEEAAASPVIPGW